MIGARQGNLRGVSGESGSCFYRSVAYQMCERAGRPYDDTREVERLRHAVAVFLRSHRDDPVPGAPQLTWRQLGSAGAAGAGAAQVPVPQAMAYVIGLPLTVHMPTCELKFGQELGGDALEVRLVREHYCIQYRPTASI